MTEKSPDSVLDLFDIPLEADELLDVENNVDELYALCDDPMQMPIKLVNDRLHFTDFSAVQDLFVENSGFLVVGVVGLQGAGKSSILNALANYLDEDTTLLDGPFAVQSVKHFMTSPRTGGIDLYITQDRVILLDTQPLLSLALTNYHSQNISDVSAGRLNVASVPSTDACAASAVDGPGNWSLNLWAEVASIQVLSFLFNVCHVVLMVTDTLSNACTRMHRLIDRATSLKPTVYTPSVLSDRFERSSTLDPMKVKCDHNISPTCRPLDFSKLHASYSKFNSAHPTSKMDENFNESESDSDEVWDNQRDATVATESFVGIQNTGRSTGLFCPHNRAVDQHVLESESSDVMDALNHLITLVDYSASLIHVYNQAPPSAFLEPTVGQKLDTYRNVLPLLYPDYRRTAAFADIGPRILSRHMSTISRSQRTVKTLSSNTRVGEISSASVRKCSISYNNVATFIENVQPSAYTCSLGRSAEENIVVHELSTAGSAPGSLSVQAERLSYKSHESVSHLAECTNVRTKEITDHNAIVDVTSGTFNDLGDSNLPVTFEGVKSTGLDSEASRPKLQHSSKSLSDLTVAEVVSVCCSVLRDIQSELDMKMSVVPKSITSCFREPQQMNITAMPQECPSEGARWNGENTNAEMAKMGHQVQSVRREFFNIQRRLNNPRLFLIPDVDGKGHSPVGCPTYAAAVRSLQEAVFSTPRQHMIPQMTEKKWIAYARKMWDAVCTSPILLDYHAVLLS